MADDVFAAMGIAGFGKATQKKKLDPARFDKTKRVEVIVIFFCGTEKANVAGIQAKKDTAPIAGPSSREEDRPKGEEPEDDEPAPKPFEEPEYDPSEEEDETVDFPITHELILKDHTKVISALALDPSGARICSGSHDYDCKLWDFGGMDMRCKPFKSWEPAGSYHVRQFSLFTRRLIKILADTRHQILKRRTKVDGHLWNDPGQTVRPRWRRTVRGL